MTEQTKTELDRVVAGHTGFKSMAELIHAPDGYFPTIRIDLYPHLEVVADAYDLCMECLNDSRRAYRVYPHYKPLYALTGGGQ